jgi:P-type Ca2+ transporter type 2C
MNEMDVSLLHLGLGILFAISYLSAVALSRFRIPGIMGALIAGVVAPFLPFGHSLLNDAFLRPLGYLADIGVLFLLFFVGLQINFKEILALGGEIVALTALKFCFTLTGVMLCLLMLGYPWPLSIVVALICMPTAEAVIIPILDNFRLLRTRLGELIIGTSVMDDIVEVILVAGVSYWISGVAVDRHSVAMAATLLPVLLYLLFIWVSYRWLVLWFCRWIPRKPSKVILFAMVILLGFAGFSELAGLGLSLGALSAGIVARPAFDRLGALGEAVMQAIQAISHGFFAQLFLFWVGLHVDVEGVIHAPLLTAALLIASSGSKLLSVFALVPMRRLSLREAWAVGISVNAGLTTELIVAQLLLNAGLIDRPLFTALVAASSIATFAVPLLLPLVLPRPERPEITAELSLAMQPHILIQPNAANSPLR